MDKNILYTAGYDGRKPDDFIALLKTNEVDFVIDLRCKDSRVFMRPYWLGEPMRTYFEGHGIGYFNYYPLANRYDELSDYLNWLSTAEGNKALKALHRWILKDIPCRYCLLGAEGSWYKDSKENVNCHRVYVADALAKMLGDDWEVKHL